MHSDGSEVKSMKFNNILMTIDQNTQIRLIVPMYGMKFSTEHFAEYYLDHKETYDLTEREVMDIRVVDNLLEVVLK